jgi:hypothetical protein
MFFLNHNLKLLGNNLCCRLCGPMAASVHFRILRRGAFLANAEWGFTLYHKVFRVVL